MAYVQKYRMQTSADLNEYYEISIDFIDYVGGIFDLIGTVDAITMRSDGADDNKLEPIIGTELLLEIFVGSVMINGTTVDDSTLRIDDLITSQDNAIRVTLYKDRSPVPVYQGFVVVEDNSEPFLDTGRTLSIRALDGLGLLKGQDFLDTTGAIFSGAHTVISWLMQILYKTNQVLNIRTYFTFVNTNDPNVDSFNKFTIPASTWQTGQATVAEQDITVDNLAAQVDDAYTALQKLMSYFCCRIFQWNNCWCVVNLQEQCDTLNGMAFEEWSMLAPTSGLVNYSIAGRGSQQRYDVPVGNQQTTQLHPINEDATRSLKLASKYVKLNYQYDSSQNKICNQDLRILGASEPYNDAVIPSNVIDASYTPAYNIQTYAWDVSCWQSFDGQDSVFRNLYPAPLAPLGQAFIRQVIDPFGNELERFLVLTETTRARSIPFFQSSRIIVDANDIIQFSFSWRLRKAITPNQGYAVACVYFFGDDGSFWALRGVADNTAYNSSTTTPAPVQLKTTWIKTTNSFRDPALTGSSIPTAANVVQNTGDISGVDLTQWQSLSINTQAPTQPGSTHLPEKTPLQGEIIFILQFPFDKTGNEMWFKDITVTILPYINGTFRQVKGDQTTFISNQDIKQNIANTIYISDSPKRYFKGALLQPDGKTLEPPTWIRKKYPTETPRRLTALMAKTTYNQTNHIIEKIEGTMRGTAYTDKNTQNYGKVFLLGFINLFRFLYHPVPTKVFLMTAFDVNLMTGQGRRTFVEALRSDMDLGWSEPDNSMATQFFYIFAT